MAQGTRKNRDAYVHYEFVHVKCSGCGVDSSGFMYKDHLDADEMVTYIEDITGFKIRKPIDDARTGYYFNTGHGYSEGGLACPKCQGIQKEEVA